MSLIYQSCEKCQKEYYDIFYKFSGFDSPDSPDSPSNKMITKTDKIKCDWCGKFVSNKDLRNGKAYNIMILPDSHISTETYESKCRDCYDPKTI